jgi:hypothetical protein
MCEKQSSNKDLTICNTGTKKVTFKSRVIATTEAAEVKTIPTMLTITGSGNVPNSTDLFGGATFERTDSPDPSICEMTEKGLSIFKRC